MQCEICKKEKKTVCILPIPREDGKPETIACYPCALKTTVFCKKHKYPYMGFSDGTSLCPKCLQRELKLNQGRKEEIWEKIFSCLSVEEYRRLFESTFFTSQIYLFFSQKDSLIWEIASFSLRKGILFDDVLKIIDEQSSAQILLDSYISEEKLHSLIETL